MKWFYKYGCIIALCFITALQGFVQTETRHTGPVALDPSAAENQFIISQLPDLFNAAASREDGQHLIQRLYPTSNKYPFGTLLLNAYTRSNKNRELSRYVRIAEYRIARLEGPDIIHPFNYFW